MDDSYLSHKERRIYIICLKTHIFVDITKKFFQTAKLLTIYIYGFYSHWKFGLVGRFITRSSIWKLKRSWLLFGVKS